MLVVGTDILHKFWSRRPECRQELSELVRELEAIRIADTHAMKARYPSCKIIDGQTVVFKIRGNRYRLTVLVSYKGQLVKVEAIETHAEYDRRKLR